MAAFELPVTAMPRDMASGDLRRLVMAIAAGLLFSAACLAAALNPDERTACLAAARAIGPAML